MSTQKSMHIHISTLALMGVTLLGAACEQEHPDILSHRAQGVGVAGENLVENVPEIFRENFGVEIDIRGDGDRLFELGHNGPEGESLGDVIDLLEEVWSPDLVGKVLVIDIADDTDDSVSRGIVPWLSERLAGSPVRQLRYIVQSSNDISLLRVYEAYQALEDPGFTIETALTVWFVVEFTPPNFVDFLTTNINELPSFPLPIPVLVFGVVSRGSYEQVLASPSDIEFVLTDHPRRIRSLQQSPLDKF